MYGTVYTLSPAANGVNPMAKKVIIISEIWIRMTINGHRGREEGRHDALNPTRHRADWMAGGRDGDIIKSRGMHERQKSGMRGWPGKPVMVIHI